MRVLFLCVVCAGLAGYPALADDADAGDDGPSRLEKGQKAPEAILHMPPAEGDENSEVRQVKLSDWRGRKHVLLAFYPKAFTGGCTKQLCGYRDDFSRFQDATVEVIAVSTDEQEESSAFRKEHKMPFTVLGDPGGDLVRAFGVPFIRFGELRLAQRAVVLIDKKGVVRYVDYTYDVDKGREPLFAAVEQLKREDGADS